MCPLVFSHRSCHVSRVVATVFAVCVASNLFAQEKGDKSKADKGPPQAAPDSGQNEAEKLFREVEKNLLAAKTVRMEFN